MSEALRIRATVSEPRKSGAYIGFAGYATILAILKQPCYHVEIAALTGIHAPKLRPLLKQMHILGLIHRVGWHKPARGCHMPIYRLGPGEDAPVPIAATGRPQPHHDFRPLLTPRMVAFASAIQVLMDGPITCGDLERESGISLGRLNELLAHMRKPEIRLIHVAAWEPRRDGSGPMTRMYRFAPDAKDVPRPRVNRKERTRNRAIARRDIQRPAWDQTVMSLKRIAGFESARA